MQDLYIAQHEREKRFKREIHTNLTRNIDAIVAYKGGQKYLSVQDLEQEAIYYACNILLLQKAETGQFKEDYIMTELIRCVTDVMQQLFPQDYTDKQATFAQEAVRINLIQAPNMQQVIKGYYDKIYQRY
jgi:hypothetical protein